ncbi:GNAT family N-acetyltransferase [Lapidilactobacillus bayanensis]|uniref:GNAT family N-acetyltransferase n=1 Tax=Lapidilactobacillus bayanensis TaxID=2485998 RepID=UPI000F7B8F59|nr:GNAT family N-acetyltransferase [Lapidilactobacillus bayanensis]
MTRIQFRLATTADLPVIMNIVDGARLFLHHQGIPQWQNGYPDQSVFRADISQQALYVGVENGQVVMMLTLMNGPDPNYQKIAGTWQQSSNHYLVLHRIAVTRSVAGHGDADAAFAFAIQMARQQGKVSLRLDTHEKNHGMRHLAEKYQFKQCGTVWMADGAPRIAFELVF